MDIIAPMSLSVEPDSVQRILMDYTELSESIPDNPPENIPAFSRDGFTVMEWGGFNKVLKTSPIGEVLVCGRGWAH
ncbi:hypothetical protein ACFLZY_00765 [Patescibacteria group bacterium]